MCDFILFCLLFPYVTIGELMYVWHHRGGLVCKKETGTRSEGGVIAPDHGTVLAWKEAGKLRSF
jgi:hypothetical protein